MIVKGYWWIPSNSQEKIAGVLTYNGKDHSTLELFGYFESIDFQYYRICSKSLDVIYGISNKGVHYSLLNNICTSVSISTNNISTFTTNIILEGFHIQDINQQCFTGELLSFEYLRTWYKEDIFEVQNNKDFQIIKCKINNWSNGRKINLPNETELEFIPTYRNSFVGRNDEIHLYQSTQLALKTQRSLSVWDFLEKSKILQQFVSLLFLTPQYFNEMSLRVENAEYFEVKVFVRNEASVKPFSWAFLEYDIIKNKLDDIICKWFKYSEDLYPIQNHLFRTLDPSKSVGNEDFLVVAQAIDGLTKGRLSLTGDLKDRINALYSKLSGILRLQNNKVDSIVFNATRNYYSHMNKGTNHDIVAKGIDLIALLQKSKLLLTCALLHLYGLSDNEIDGCLTNSQFVGWMYLNMK